MLRRIQGRSHLHELKHTNRSPPGILAPTDSSAPGSEGAWSHDNHSGHTNHVSTLCAYLHKPSSRKRALGREAGQPSWSSMRRALASIRFSAADRPRSASRPARSRTTSTTWTRFPDASFSRFALYRCDQLRESPPLDTIAQPISKLSGSLPETKARSQDDSDRTHCHAALRSPGRAGLTG